MFRKKPPPLVGAAAKLEAAKKWRDTKEAALESSRGRGSGGGEVALALIFCMAAGIAHFLMQRVAAGQLSFRLPHAGLHKWLVAMPPPSVMGDADLDMAIAVMLRGGAVFALAGIVPGLAKLLQKVDRRKDGSSALFLLWLASALVFMAGAAALRVFY